MVAWRLQFSDDKINKLIKTYYWESLARYFIVPHVASGLTNLEGVKALCGSAMRKILRLP